MTHDHQHDHRLHADGTDCHCEPESEAVSAIDPVCGMTVDKGATNLTADHNGQTYYFCSPGCRTAFVANPAAYVGHGNAA
jgi:YHS domain-containing protein